MASCSLQWPRSIHVASIFRLNVYTMNMEAEGCSVNLVHTYHAIRRQVPDDTAVSQDCMYYYWFRMNCHILLCGSQLTKLQKWSWMYMWGFASTIECESSVPQRHSACSKQTITWLNLILSVYPTITLLYICLQLKLKDKEYNKRGTRLWTGFTVYGSGQARQWTLRFHPCRWLPWPPESRTIAQESSWWRHLSSYTCGNIRWASSVKHITAMCLKTGDDNT
jgi:hypothetical protein